MSRLTVNISRPLNKHVLIGQLISRGLNLQQAIKQAEKLNKQAFNRK